MQKSLPFTKEQLKNIIKSFPTPFHIYDEAGIKNSIARLKDAFSWNKGFTEYFAVKANPNPHILKIMKDCGCGADCSSMAELVISERVGLNKEKIVFTSNDTPAEDYKKAYELGAIINLDDITHIDFLESVLGGKLPKMLCFRYNPGNSRTGGNSIIGKPAEAKYGLTKEQLFKAYSIAKDKGVKQFGLHTMVISNELNADFFIETARMLFALVEELYQELGVEITWVDFGGGIGIPYKPEDREVDLKYIGDAVKEMYNVMISEKGLAPINLALECGRVITGPYGYLVSKVLHKKNTYKNYIGLDACMADLMRPALYGAYHHISVIGKEDNTCNSVYDVTGSLCENNDKFAIDRCLPEIDIGDVLVIHDTGAHGHSMGFNYNGKMRSAELMLCFNGDIKQIRRAETLDDYFATLDFNNL